MRKTAFAIVAHPDDEIIGLGGTLYKHTKQGDTVHVLILGDGKSSRKDQYKPLQQRTKDLSQEETRKALKTLNIRHFYKENLPDNRFDSLQLLEIVKTISKYMKKISPSIVYTHHYGDMNIDHQKCSEAVMICCRPIENNSVEEVRMFETLSSTEMAGFEAKNLFLPNLFVDIHEELQAKIDAMACYKSELHDFPHPRSLKAIEYNAHLWGAKNNLIAAEAFHIFRSVKTIA